MELSPDQKFSSLRLLAAVLVAFVASMVWFGLFSCEPFNSMGAYWGNILLGLSGVFFGAFCFRTRHRFIGSIILLIGGVAIDGFFEDSDDKVYPLSVFWVALGGLIPVAFFGLLAAVTKCRHSPPHPQNEVASLK